jgi:hypothetical protein
VPLLLVLEGKIACPVAASSTYAVHGNKILHNNSPAYVCMYPSFLVLARACVHGMATEAEMAEQMQRKKRRRKLAGGGIVVLCPAWGPHLTAVPGQMTRRASCAPARIRL